jgi:hypothetical protein
VSPLSLCPEDAFEKLIDIIHIFLFNGHYETAVFRFICTVPLERPKVETWVVFVFVLF